MPTRTTSLTALIAIALTTCGSPPSETAFTATAPPALSVELNVQQVGRGPTPPLTSVATVPGGRFGNLSEVAFADPLHGWALGYAPGPNVIARMMGRTSDGGEHWMEMSSPEVEVSACGWPSGERFLGHLRFATPQRGWLYGPCFVFGTQDGGDTWSSEAISPDAFGATVGDSVWTLRGCAPPLAGCMRELWVSDDGGQTWAAAPSQPPLAGPEERQLLRASSLDAWLLTISNGPVRDPEHALVVTHDGGATWDPLPVPNTGWAAGIATLRIPAPDQLWLVCEGVPGAGNQTKWLYTSSDSGQTWSRPGAYREIDTTTSNHIDVGNLPTRGYFAGLVLLAPDHAFLALHRGGLLVTRDAGATWNFAGVPNENDSGVHQVVFLDDLHGWAVTQGTVWRTTDGGEHWSGFTP